MDDLDLRRRQADLVDAEAPQRLRDRDHARRLAGHRPLDEPERPAPEAVVVVLRRDERRAARRRTRRRRRRARGACARSPARAARSRGAPGARGRGRGRAGTRSRTDSTPSSRVERLDRPGGVVEPEEHGLDPVLAQRRQQRQQMPLGAADPADPVDVDDPHARRRRSTAHQIAARRGEREQEVPRHPVPRRAGEAHRHERLVARGAPPPATRSRRGSRNTPTSASRKSGIEYAGCAQRAQLVDDPARLRAPLRLQRLRVPEHLGRLAGELRLLAGMVLPELDDEVPVEPHPRALVHRQHLPVDLVVVARELWRRRLVRKRRHVVDPLPGGERVVGVQVVRLPERARVGRDREAADRHLVPDDPGRDRQHRRREHHADEDPGAAVPPDEERAADDRQEEQARVPEDREAEQHAQDRAEPERPPLPEGEHAEHDRGREQLVEDLAVLVDVVPDEVRVQRRDHRGDHARPSARRSAARSRRSGARSRRRPRSG